MKPRHQPHYGPLINESLAKAQPDMPIDCRQPSYHCPKATSIVKPYPCYFSTTRQRHPVPSSPSSRWFQFQRDRLDLQRDSSDAWICSSALLPLIPPAVGTWKFIGSWTPSLLWLQHTFLAGHRWPPLPCKRGKNCPIQGAHHLHL